jgi:hypothetical protein
MKVEKAAVGRGRRREKEGEGGKVGHGGLVGFGAFGIKVFFGAQTTQEKIKLAGLSSPW